VLYHSVWSIQPAVNKESDTSKTYHKTETELLYQRHHDSFGFVSLVDLPPGLVLCVAGVDEEDDDDDDDYYDDTDTP